MDNKSNLQEDTTTQANVTDSGNEKVKMDSSPPSVIEGTNKRAPFIPQSFQWPLRKFRSSQASRIPSRTSSWKMSETSNMSADSGEWESSTSTENYDFSHLNGGILMYQSDKAEIPWQPYVLVGKETSLEDLGAFMTKFWKLPSPKVVLSIISNNKYFVRPSDSRIEDLQIGLLEAARLTTMWIMTEGLNTGVGKIIGDVVMTERIWRQNMGTAEQARYRVGSKLVVIGVVPSNSLFYGEALERDSKTVTENRKFPLETHAEEGRCLDPNHTHCIILRGLDAADVEAQWNTRFAIESKLVQFSTRKRAVTVKQSQEDELQSKDQAVSPVVGLLLQGGPEEIERVLWMLKKQMPVICIAKSGFASGLLAYAFYEGLKGGDSQHLESIVKPQLMQLVARAFPEYCHDNDLGRMQCRDKILDCVKHAVQGECRYLTIVDPSETGFDMKDLNMHILTAIINSERGPQDANSRDKINWNLRLCLHWNTSQIAASKILKIQERFRVKEELFMEALLLPHREEFVQLFLNMGFMIYRFLMPTRYYQLFDNSLQDEFFVTICLEKILRISPASMTKKFISGPKCPLNRLLKTLTGLKRLVNSNQLLVAHMANRAVDKQMAERKALLALIYWAVLTNRQGLAKVLWKRSTEPIAVALVISNMYNRMSKYWITDIDLKIRVKNAAVEFGRAAIEVMDVTFNDSSIMAYHSLITPISDFNYLSVVDLALMGDNIFFISHPCCQRTIRERWLGKIKIKPFTTSSIVIPEFVKIYMCLFLVLPMYFWVTFDTTRRPHETRDGDRRAPEMDESHNYDKNNSRKLFREEWGLNTAYPHYGKSDPYATPPLWRKIYFMWTAPVSKFWLNQLSVLAYLVLFAVALMIPFCGNFYINAALCAWTVIMFIEHSKRIIWKNMKYPTLNIFWSALDLLNELFVINILGLLVLQQQDYLPVHVPHVSYRIYKFLLSLGMLFMYFRALSYVLPVSQELGPMLVNISQLTRRDLINWFRLWMLCMVSGALAIHVALYPARPFTWSVLWNALMRGGLVLFLTEISDLEGSETCSSLYNMPEVGNTCNVSSIQPHVLHRLQTCPYYSKATYGIVIQFLLISRQVFYTLMFAMFSTTINRTKERSVEIWKAQFYSIVTDFEMRPVLPVPLTPITYPFRILFFLGHCTIKALVKCFATCTGMDRRPKKRKMTYAIPYNKWKSYLSTISKREGEKESKMDEILGFLEDGNASQKTLTKRLNDRLATIEKNQIMMAFTLEHLINSLKGLDSNKQAQGGGQARQIHTASRISPYPGTDIQRFPVLEKDVPWDVKFESYDPVTYTKPTSEYPAEFHMWLDLDLLELQVHPEHEPTEEARKSRTSIPLGIAPIYNTLQTISLPYNRRVTINRYSYLTANDQPVMYETDATGVPKNPMGRTGLRGRGNLWRWGPNHMIQAAISRLASTTVSTGGQGTEASQAKAIEVLVMKEDPDSTSICLPGSKVLGDQTPYSALCEFIIKDVFGQADVEMEPDFDQDKMVEYFSQFASNEMTVKKKSMYANFGYSSFLVYRGYADDPSNTDNAWKETEIWNFHYKLYKDNFERKFKELENASWMTVSSALPLLPSEVMAVIETAKIHNAHY